MLKKIVIGALILILTFCGIIIGGLYLMEIEDHYGDLQDVYFDTKSGDIIINKQTQKFGIITKNWKRADVITKENDTLDLYNFIYINQKENKYEVFRSENELNIPDLTFEEILELKSKNLIETIIKN